MYLSLLEELPSIVYSISLALFRSYPAWQYADAMSSGDIIEPKASIKNSKFLSSASERFRLEAGPFTIVLRDTNNE
ncbi:hypothetical protein Hanom_Chr12g01082441 [Helianthus anomalus]